MSTFQVIKRLLGEAKPLAGLMVAASTAGTIGHLAATFLPVFGIIAGFALAGNPVTTTIVYAIVAATLSPWMVSALIAAFMLLASSFGPTLALAALPANLTQTFASARRLFSLMDEAPGVVETGTANSDYEGMRLDRVTFAYPGEESEAILADFSLDVPQHGILGIQGPSGRGQVHYAEAADALLGPAAWPSDSVRHAATANRYACPPPYSGHDESGDPPVRRHDSRESAYRLA